MLVPRITHLACLFASACLFSCGDDGVMEGNGETGSDTGTPGLQCTPGEEIACTCSDGRSGTQMCLAGGFEVSACMCDAPGTSTTTTTTDPTMTSAADSTTGGAACGDGTVDEGEECDDGNIAPGDECRVDCTLPTELLWMISHDGPTSGPDSGAQVLVASDDTFYLLGTEVNDLTGTDVWLRHIDADGNELWTTTYDGPASVADRGADMVFHPSGDIIVAGTITTDAANGRDFFAMRVTAADGTIVWLHSSDGTGAEGDNDDFASGVAVDDAGNVYVSGQVRTADALGDIFLRKLAAADGAEIWTETHNGSADLSDFGNDVVVDGDGNVYVGGSSNETGAGADAWLRKYDTDGIVLWTQTYSVDALDQSILALDVDPSGDIIAGGYEEQAEVGLVAWLRRYDADGNDIWTETDNVGTGDDSVRAVHVDAAGNIFAAGVIGITGESANAWLRRHSDDGTPQWSFSYNNDDANLTEIASGVTVDSNGDIVLVGAETVPGEDRNIWAAKIREAP